MATTKTNADGPLDTWLGLQEYLRAANEEQCWNLLKDERADKRRPQYILRIFSRANKLRTERERLEVLSFEDKDTTP